MTDPVCTLNPEVFSSELFSKLAVSPPSTFNVGHTEGFELRSVNWLALSPYGPITSAPLFRACRCESHEFLVIKRKEQTSHEAVLAVAVLDCVYADGISLGSAQTTLRVRFGSEVLDLASIDVIGCAST